MTPGSHTGDWERGVAIRGAFDALGENEQLAVACAAVERWLLAFESVDVVRDGGVRRSVIDAVYSAIDGSAIAEGLLEGWPPLDDPLHGYESFVARNLDGALMGVADGAVERDPDRLWRVVGLVDELTEMLAGAPALGSEALDSTPEEVASWLQERDEQRRATGIGGIEAAAFDESVAVASVGDLRGPALLDMRQRQIHKAAAIASVLQAQLSEETAAGDAALAAAPWRHLAWFVVGTIDRWARGAAPLGLVVRGSAGDGVVSALCTADGVDAAVELAFTVSSDAGTAAVGLIEMIEGVTHTSLAAMRRGDRQALIDTLGEGRRIAAFADRQARVPRRGDPAMPSIIERGAGLASLAFVADDRLDAESVARYQAIQAHFGDRLGHSLVELVANR